MEKRGRQRKKIRLPVRFGADRPDHLGLVTDVSARGVYIATNAVLPRGSVVRIRVPLPGAAPVLLDGQVARIRRVAPMLMSIATGGMGVRLRNAPSTWRADMALPDD